MIFFTISFPFIANPFYLYFDLSLGLHIIFIRKIKNDNNSLHEFIWRMLTNNMRVPYADAAIGCLCSLVHSISGTSIWRITEFEDCEWRDFTMFELCEVMLLPLPLHCKHSKHYVLCIQYGMWTNQSTHCVRKCNLTIVVDKSVAGYEECALKVKEEKPKESERDGNEFKWYAYLMHSTLSFKQFDCYFYCNHKFPTIEWYIWKE